MSFQKVMDWLVSVFFVLAGLLFILALSVQAKSFQEGAVGVFGVVFVFGILYLTYWGTFH